MTRVALDAELRLEKDRPARNRARNKDGFLPELSARQEGLVRGVHRAVQALRVSEYTTADDRRRAKRQARAAIRALKNYLEAWEATYDAPVSLDNH